jgi:hypothetical protein
MKQYQYLEEKLCRRIFYAQTCQKANRATARKKNTNRNEIEKVLGSL